ncbi:MAG: STAS domain-containing protein [Fibrella sp.]|nr:STAS domain-containing protein [Armatimonadota bacterium]
MAQIPVKENSRPGDEESFFSVSHWREGDALFLSLQGEVDMHTVGELHRAITEGLQDGVCTHVVADMSRVPFIDSTGYSAFVAATQTLRARGEGRVNLAGCQPVIVRVLGIVRLNRMFGIHDSLEQARKSLSRQTNPV